MEKNKYLYSIITIMLVLVLVTITNRLYNYPLTYSDNVFNSIISRIDDENITNDFLLWINKNYGKESLISLDKYLSKNNYSNDIWHEITGNSYHVLMDLYQKKDIQNQKIVNGNNTISFVGDVSLADDWYIMPKYDERNRGIYGILSEEVVDIMRDSGLMVANNEFTVSDRGERIPGKVYTFRASPRRLAIYEEMGVDLVTLANNHVYDFGRDAFYDMLDSLDEYHIPYIGAGRNIDEAKRPYYFVLNGYKFAFVNATRAEKVILTPEATDDEGGVFRCYDSTGLINLIKEVKEDSDYVITLIHWGREDSHELEDDQREISKLYIDAGSDIIVGTHAHVLQGIEFYNGKPIVYNIGDFIFNNEIKDTGIFQMKLDEDGNFNYYFIPALQRDEYTTLLKDDEKLRVINDMNMWSINAIINSDGEVIEKAQ